MVKWESRSSKQRNRIFWLLLIITTLYLPVFRDSILVFSCDIRFFPPSSETCYNELHIGLCFLASMALIFYIFACPVSLWRIVSANRPHPSLYDNEGNERIGGCKYFFPKN